MERELLPIFAEFGAAVHDAQLLEHGLRLAIVLASDIEKGGSNKERKLVGFHRLLKTAQESDVITSDQAEILEKAKGIRNRLVHDYMFTNSGKISAPNGRSELLSDIVGIRETLLDAGKLVDYVVDRYLEMLGTSIEEIQQSLDSAWVADGDYDPFLH